MNKKGLYIGEKPDFFSPERHTSKNPLVLGKAGRGMAYFLASQYETCEREGQRILVVDPKSDFK
ncbi:hypothetical protein [Bacillus subtilis]|uniref:hypothetical protein n=1 Tax=Bacillus subtilis TaxID=1423 RepID=UPI002DBBC9A3|nr:hypothetical protein [Bacillus subtilis]MEC0524278.1 hypothetical protein [Bacillus subtilis]